MVNAWFYKEYGSVDVLQFGEIEASSAGPGHVLIKVRAAALNPADYKIRQYGMGRSADAPFPVVPGFDVAGVYIVDIAPLPPHLRAVQFIVKPRGSNLERLGKYIESGKLKAVIDPKNPYTFSDVLEAFKHLESGRARGKIVISPIE
ncbi:hypothetical protein SUGI_0972610 [Cryptomeria japonica]|uniref:2-methylene-furan-3-one reductase-like n=1 Tax=Cryptomeria japonica TaxID=3369 RepID=UPI0024146C3D|nr:2-methylene-furan-3-one reductase-like [Cryptomeria japonica]GLJ46173.1 hypothetical protein SUGI_0972610 [Cryptomeria japonica]